MSTPRALTALILALCLQGCATSWFSNSGPDPDIRLLKVERVKAHLLAQTFILHFRIDNPAPHRVPVHSFTYRVKIGDIVLAEGTANDWFSVPAAGTTFYNVQVHTNLWQHLKPLAAMLKNRDTPVTYELKGVLKTGIFFGRHITVRRTDAIIPGQLIAE